MEKARDWEEELLVDELMQGLESAKELWVHLDMSSPAGLLVKKIQSSLTNALSMLNSSDQVVEHSVASLSSTISINTSLPTRDLSFFSEEESSLIPNRVKLPSQIPDDGYRWRNYGQKNTPGVLISYYKCSGGCHARKRVRISTEDSSILDIKHHGVHTCVHATHLLSPSALPIKQEQQQHQQSPLNFQVESEVSNEVQGSSLELSLSIIPPASAGTSNPIETITLPSKLDDHFMEEENHLLSPSVLPIKQEQQQHQQSPLNFQVESEVSNEVQGSSLELSLSIIPPASAGTSNPIETIALPSKLDDHFMDEENVEASVISFFDSKLSGPPMYPKPSAIFSKESSPSQDILHGSFEHIHRISVLDLSHTKIEFLPESISNLKKLWKLLFRHCERLKMIPSLAKLKELRVLDLSHTIIKELPQGMDELVNLRCLDLSYTRNLQIYPVGVLHQLPLLEDLLMFESGCCWPLNSSNVLEGADIKEIVRSTHLANLAIRFVDLRSFVAYVRTGHWQVLKSFRFDIGWVSNCLPLASFRWKYSVQILGCDLIDEKDSLVLPDNTLELVIRNCHGISCLLEMECISQLRNLKECSVVDCDEMECILMVETNIWPTIGELILYNLPKLRTLCRGVQPFTTLANLKSMTVEHCHNLDHLFAFGYLEYFPSLEYVRVSMCDKIEEIVAEDEEMADMDHSNIVSLPRLKEVRFGFLRELRSISKRVMVCDSLVTIVVQNCPKLKKLPLSFGNVAPSLEMIKGSRKWWDALEWDDFKIKTSLQTVFVEQSDLESESELGSESEEDQDQDHDEDDDDDDDDERRQRKRRKVQL